MTTPSRSWFANLYVSGLGTKDIKAWWPMRLPSNQAYKMLSTAQRRSWAFSQVKADWCYDELVLPRDHVQWTTLPPVVDGLEVIIAEARASLLGTTLSENGLVTQSGGYPGEDLRFACWVDLFTCPASGWGLSPPCSHNLDLKVKKAIESQNRGLRKQFWHDRNYLLQADKVRRGRLHPGSQDWNISPMCVNVPSLPANIKAHLFYHRKWSPCLSQQLAVKWLPLRSMNITLLSKKLLGYDSKL